MISADDVLSTLAFLIPGFVALKLIYWFGQRSKRADWEWTLWALLISAPIAFASNLIAEGIGSKPTDLAKAIGDCGLLKGAGKTGTELQAAISSCASDAFAAHNADLRLAISLVVAAVFALVAVGVWKWLTARYPRLRRRASLMVWDAVLRDPHRVQLKVGDRIFAGKVDGVADPTETEDLDIYLTEPSLVQGSAAVPLSVTAGIIVARDKIDWIQVLK